MLSLLSNPIHGGAYAFGKTKARTKVIDGRARKTAGHKKPRCEWTCKWTVLIPDYQPGYISREQDERCQAMLAADVRIKSGMEPKAGRGGRALLSGLLRCRRCGRMELAVAGELLRAIGGNAVEAAVEAAEKMRRHFQEQRRAVELELEQARYAAKLSALRKAQALEDRLRAFDDAGKMPAIPAAAGGRHSELRVSKPGTGQHGHSTGVEAIEVSRQMAGRFTAGETAATLNRLSLRTRADNSWNAQRVCALRRNRDLPNDVNSPVVQPAIDSARSRKRPPTPQDERDGRLFSGS